MGDIYGRYGDALDWFQDDVVYGNGGRIRAYVRDGAVFTPEGAYVGQLDSGIFRDQSGKIVAFLRGASDPALGRIPTLQEVGPPPMPLDRPPFPKLPQAPQPAKPQEAWSDLGWDQYINGYRGGSTTDESSLVTGPGS